MSAARRGPRLKIDGTPIPASAARLIKRLRGRSVTATAADAPEAIASGNGYLYLLQPGNTRAPARDVRFLIDNFILEPVGDALLPGMSQTYKLRSGL